MYTPKEKGADVVKAVVDRITELGIFPDDHKFMCRIGWVESKYGTDKGTYRPGYHGGIWQVSHYTRKINAHRKCVVQEHPQGTNELKAKYWPNIHF